VTQLLGVVGMLTLAAVAVGAQDREAARQFVIDRAKSLELDTPYVPPPGDPLEHPVTGLRGRLPVNFSGGLKARGHPVGGTGLFQIAECHLQLVGRFPNPRAQLANAKVGVAHSIGGPGNNVYVTVLERADSKRKPEAALRPQLSFRSTGPARISDERQRVPVGRAVLEAFTSIHVTSGGAQSGPVHVGLVRIAGHLAFAKLDHPPGEGEPAESVLAGQRVRLLLKDDGDQYFQMPKGLGFDLAGMVERVRARVGLGRAAVGAATPAGPATNPDLAPVEPALSDEVARPTPSPAGDDEEPYESDAR